MGIPKWTCFIVAWILLGVLTLMGLGVRLLDIVSGEGVTIPELALLVVFVALLVVSIVQFREQRRKAQSRETDQVDQ